MLTLSPLNAIMSKFKYGNYKIKYRRTLYYLVKSSNVHTKVFPDNLYLSILLPSFFPSIKLGCKYEKIFHLAVDEAILNDIMTSYYCEWVSRSPRLPGGSIHPVNGCLEAEAVLLHCAFGRRLVKVPAVGQFRLVSFSCAIEALLGTNWRFRI